MDRRPPRNLREPGRRLLLHVPRLNLARLPRAVAVALLHHRSDGRGDVSDVRRMDVDSTIHIESYWLRFRGEEGPAASVYYGGREGLRVDLIGEHPHLHMHCSEERRLPGPPRRVPLEPGAGGDPARRVVDQIAARITDSLQLDVRRHIRRHRPEPTAMAAALDDTRRHLEHLASAHAAAAGPPRSAGRTVSIAQVSGRGPVGSIGSAGNEEGGG